MVLLTGKEPVLCLMATSGGTGSEPRFDWVDSSMLLCHTAGGLVLSFGKQPIKRQRYGHFDECQLVTCSECHCKQQPGCHALPAGGQATTTVPGASKGVRLRNLHLYVLAAPENGFV